MTVEPRPPLRSFRAMIPSALWPAALMITIFHASGERNLPGGGVIPYADKIAHFFVFGLLATLIVRVVFEPRQPFRWAVIALSITSAYGAFDEVRQSFTPDRSVEVADWFADTLGAAVAAGVYCFWTTWRRFLERRYEPRRKPRAKEMPAMKWALDDDVKTP